MADVFISYARTDNDFVRKLHQSLEEINRDIWIDWEDIPPTAEWLKELYASIAAADNFLFIISPNSCASKMCREELAYAEANHKRLVPVVYVPVAQEDLPPALARIQWISFNDSPFDSAFRSLVQAIDTDLDWVHEHTRLLVRAKEWEVRDRDASLLLRGKDLIDAELWQSKAANREPKPVELQSQFLFTSRQAQTRRNRSVLGGVTAALIFTLLLAVFALLELRLATIRGNQALSRQFAVQSILDSQTDLGARMHEAVAAIEKALTGEAVVALNGALAGPHERFILHHDQNAGGVSSVAYSPDGKRIVTASTDGTAKVWDAENGHLLLTLYGHKALVESAFYSPIGDRIVTASDDYTAKVWDAQTGHSLVALIGHSCAVNSAVFSPDGKRIVTASDDHTARVWDVSSGRLLFPLDPKDKIPVDYAAYLPDGSRIVTASDDGAVRVWNAKDGKFLYPLVKYTGVPYDPCGADRNRKPKYPRVMNHAFFSSIFGTQIVMPGPNHTAQVWDAENGHPLSSLTGHTDNVASAAFSLDGRHVVTASDDWTARVWDANNGHLEASLTGHAAKVYAAFFFRDGKRVVTTGWDETARVWNAGDGQLLATLAGHQGLVVSAVTSIDGQRVVTASRDATARVWDLQDGRLQASLAGHSGPVNGAFFSPDSGRVVTASDDHTARVWDPANGQLLWVLKNSAQIG
jgi:WD40 repeat protein